MTKNEAIEAMHKGEKVTHRYFSDEEFVYMKGHDRRTVWTEDGAHIAASIFWDDRAGDAWETDWSLFDSTTLNPK